MFHISILSLFKILIGVGITIAASVILHRGLKSSTAKMFVISVLIYGLNNISGFFADSIIVHHYDEVTTYFWDNLFWGWILVTRTIH